MTTSSATVISIDQPQKEFIFEQVHLDVSRNATDDFNLFHDKKKWQAIQKNPFKGPILLGFQLEALIEDQIKKHRTQENTTQHPPLLFSNYKFNFAGAIKPNEPIEIHISKTRIDNKNQTISNRVCIKKKGRLVISGQQKESTQPLYLTNKTFSLLEDLAHIPDRSFVLDRQFFLKKKFMTTSNAKNFLAGSLIEQSNYIDEVIDKVSFPEMFPCSFISCALLEKAKLDQLDFCKSPSVYTQHKISINRRLVGELKSNSPIYILINNQPFCHTSEFECYGLTVDKEIIFRAVMSLAQL